MKRFKLYQAFSFLMAMVLFSCTNSSNSLSSEIQSFYAYSTLEINPGIGLMINEQNRVVYAHAINSDGEMVMLQLHLENKLLENALSELATEMVALKFMNSSTVNPQVLMDTLGPNLSIQSQVRSTVQNRLEQAMSGQMITIQTQTRTYTQDEIDQENAKGVSPLQWCLVHQAMIGQDDLFEEEALELSPEALLNQARLGAVNMKKIAATLGQDYLEERKLIHDTYRPQIQALELAIQTALNNSESTVELETQLAALKAEMVAEIQLLVAEYRQQTLMAREQWQNQADDRRGGNGNSSGSQSNTGNN